MAGIVLSMHAYQRCSKRNLSKTDISIVMRYGRELYTAGAVFYFLGRRDIPEHLKPIPQVTRLEGTVVVMASDADIIVTAYRNRHAIKDIRRKLKRYIPKRKAA